MIFLNKKVFLQLSHIAIVSIADILCGNPSKSEVRRSLAVVAGMKKTNDQAEPTKVER